MLLVISFPLYFSTAHSTTTLGTFGLSAVLPMLALGLLCLRFHCAGRTAIERTREFIAHTLATLDELTHILHRFPPQHFQPAMAEHHLALSDYVTEITSSIGSHASGDENYTTYTPTQARAFIDTYNDFMAYLTPYMERDETLPQYLKQLPELFVGDRERFINTPRVSPHH